MIVELFSAAFRRDDLPPIFDQRRERGPSQRPWIQRLRVHLTGIAGPQEKIAALHPSRNGKPRQAQHGGRHIDDAHRPAMLGLGHARSGDDERNPQRAVVEQHPVRALSVFAEALAVVAEDHDERGAAGTRFGDGAKQAADFRVRVGDLPIVGNTSGARQGVGGRRVRRVRIVEMRPQEERPAG